MAKHPELTFFPEKPNLRVRCKSINILFRDITEKEFIPLYDKSINFVRSYFKKDRVMRIHPGIKEDVYMRFTREIALHWMYYYIINGLKVRVTKDDLEHPQTYQIAMGLSEKLSKNGSKAHRIAAEILGIGLEEYERWLRGHLQWLAMM
jgi:hypothetical protein